MEFSERELLDALAGLLAVLGCFTMLLLQRYGTSYGRYSSSSWCWQVPARLAWVLQELPSLALPLLECALADHHLRRAPNALLLAMFIIHYAHRTLIFPFLIRGGKPTPLPTFVLAVLFCIFNGYLQGRFLSRYADYPADWLTDPRFVTGFVLWLAGMVMNIHSDYILRNLRKPGETGYKIPRGGLFEYVTAANYFGEIVEWFGYAMATWSVQGASFSLFTFCVLSSRAQQHHRASQNAAVPAKKRPSKSNSLPATMELQRSKHRVTSEEPRLPATLHNHNSAPPQSCDLRAPPQIQPSPLEL
ncbi:PREDICTED: 3-oxo-5-alpha-steroid 4-dehydrogenase 1 [Elephantulus edwardii]|uniref:3-oxo-5-alpha-steroid 4-dehydrogenase 1 n=1 Tax=Elephantulus edwardii TaxID=28737 RepID=UPI0003F0AA2B|nr:PREDICTED: 3-oxo-5-alpha-steroid 4-dehydrogenase 1 [Elephantulus edwardii]